MIYKTPRQEREWAQLVAGSYMIVPVVLLVAETSTRLFGKQIVITDIHRTQAEHLALCKATGTSTYPTVHTFWRAVDLRSSIYKGDEIDIMLEIVNSRFEYGRGKKTAICHDIGAGRHFHLQAPADRGTWRG